MTRLGFLSLIVAVKPDRGPVETHNHIRVERRGVLYCTLPGSGQGSYPPLVCENNSPFAATITYRNQTFTAEEWSTTTYDT